MWLEFEILESGEVFYDGALWSKEEFVEQFSVWLDSAGPGEYEVENLTAD